jgi:hypothetical protein
MEEIQYFLRLRLGLFSFGRTDTHIASHPSLHHLLFVQKDQGAGRAADAAFNCF